MVLGKHLGTGAVRRAYAELPELEPEQAE